MAQVVVDVVHPDIINLVHDNVFDAEQAQNPLLWYFRQPLPQTAIGRGFGQEEPLQLDVAPEGEHSTVIAIYAGDLVNQGQVGGQYLFQLGDHHVVIDSLMRQLVLENLLDFP